MNRVIAKGDADLMMDVGIFVSVISGLLVDDMTEQECEGNRFLSDYRIDGLMRGLKLAGQRLCDRSEWVTGVVEKDEAEKELAQAALARRQGQSTSGSTNVRKVS